MNVRNYIHLTGNLGAAPTTFVLPSGDLSCTFSMATNEYYRDKDGKKITRTEWHTIKAYGKLAEVFVEHLGKGSMIAVVGSMRYRTWEDKFDQKRTTAEVIAREFTFLSASQKPDGEVVEGQTMTGARATAANSVDAEIEEMMYDTMEPATTPARSRNKTANRRSPKAKANV